MDHYAAVTEHYDGRAGTYDDSTLHRGLTEAVADVVGDPGRVVLDVATGTGLMLRSLAARWPGRDFVGVDLSAGMLRIARAALPDAALARADAAALPLPDRTIDLLTCVTALHLFPDPGAVFAEWRRVLRPGGRVVTATFREASKSPRQELPQDFVRRHANYRSPDRVSEALAPFGLVQQEHFDWSHEEHRLLICVSHCDA